MEKIAIERANNAPHPIGCRCDVCFNAYVDKQLKEQNQTPSTDADDAEEAYNRASRVPKALPEALPTHTTLTTDDWT